MKHPLSLIKAFVLLFTFSDVIISKRVFSGLMSARPSPAFITAAQSAERRVRLSCPPAGTWRRGTWPPQRRDAIQTQVKHGDARYDTVNLHKEALGQRPAQAARVPRSRGHAMSEEAGVQAESRCVLPGAGRARGSEMESLGSDVTQLYQHPEPASWALQRGLSH